MNAAGPAPDALATLLGYVGRVRDRRLAEIRGAADAQCRELLAAARARARAQVRQALAEARRDADGRIAQARSAAQSRLRHARHALTARALAAVRPRVEQALRARWADPAGRQAWMRMALAEAARHLPAGAWTVALPPGVALPRAPAVPDGVTLEPRGDQAIDAGLRIGLGGAELDATVAGLLQARDRVAALWLGELERLRRAASP